MFFQTKISYFVGKGYYRRDGVPFIPRKIYNVINVKVEFGDGEDKISLDAIAERAKKYQPKPKVK